MNAVIVRDAMESGEKVAKKIIHCIYRRDFPRMGDCCCGFTGVANTV